MAGQNWGASRRQMLQGLAVGGLGLTAARLPGRGIAAARAVTAPSGGFDPRRWWQHDYRIVQTNLREIDALDDPREIARAVRAFGGNVIVSNIGGIVAFYPTKLPLQYRDPYLKGNFAGEMIEAAHVEGLAYIGRFDLSKAMKPAYEAHPDWFMLNRDGTAREYAGTYQACPNGGWARSYGLEILREGLGRYKPDGVFFNMTGYPRTDYSNVDHGICVCDNCRRGFWAMFGKELPEKEAFADPTWRDYLDFQQRTADALADRTETFARPLIPGVPMTRFDGYTQVGRGEVQRRVDRRAPEWAYQAGEQCRVALARHPGRPWSSTSAAHIDYPWRQVTETADYHLLRFAQEMGVGAKLDLYLMGTLGDQDDQTWLAPISALFQWRKANEAAYTGMAQSARIGLYHSAATERLAGLTPYASFQTGCFRGAYGMLVDSRLPFQLVSDARIADGTTALAGQFDAIVMPNVMMLSDAEAKALNAFVEAGGLLIATGMTGGYDERGNPRAAMPLAAHPLAAYGKPAPAQGWSLDPVGGALKVTGRVPLDGWYFGGRWRPGMVSLIPFAPDQRFGPPEFSYAVPGVAARTEPGVALLAQGRGKVVHIPWLVGWHYLRDGLPVLQQVLAEVIARHASGARATLVGDGAVELTEMQRADGARLWHVVNYAGQRGGRYDHAPALHGLTIGVPGAVAGPALALVSGAQISGVMRADAPGLTWFALPPVGAFEALLLPA